MLKVKSKPRGKSPLKKKSEEADIYSGLHPELARLARAKKAHPIMNIDVLYVPGLLDHKTADQIDVDIRKLREG